MQGYNLNDSMYNRYKAFRESLFSQGIDMSIINNIEDKIFDEDIFPILSRRKIFTETSFGETIPSEVTNSIDDILVYKYHHVPFDEQIIDIITNDLILIGSCQDYYDRGMVIKQYVDYNVSNIDRLSITAGLHASNNLEFIMVMMIMGYAIKSGDDLTSQYLHMIRHDFKEILWGYDEYGEALINKYIPAFNLIIEGDIEEFAMVKRIS